MLVVEALPVFGSSGPEPRGIVYPSLLHFIAVNHLALGAYGAAVLGLCLFLRGLQLFARNRSSGRAPNVSVSAAIPGPATVSGAASGSRTLTAPITGKPCFVYRTSIFQRNPTVRNGRMWPKRLAISPSSSKIRPENLQSSRATPNLICAVVSAKNMPRRPLRRHSIQ